MPFDLALFYNFPILLPLLPSSPEPTAISLHPSLDHISAYAADLGLTVLEDNLYLEKKFIMFDNLSAVCGKVNAIVLKDYV